MRTLILLVLFPLIAFGQGMVLDTTRPGYLENWEMRRMLDTMQYHYISKPINTEEAQAAKEKFCAEFGHDPSEVGWSTLAHCPSYTLDLPDRVLRIDPNCNITRQTCKRCGQNLSVGRGPDTVVVRVFTDPKVIQRRKELLSQMETKYAEELFPGFRSIPDTTIIISDTTRSRPDTTYRVKWSIKSQWGPKVIDTMWVPLRLRVKSGMPDRMVDGGGTADTIPLGKHQVFLARAERHLTREELLVAALDDLRKALGTLANTLDKLADRKTR